MINKIVYQELCFFARKTYERRLVRGTGGNFSARVEDSRMLITASGLSLGDTDEGNLITMDINTHEWQSQDNYAPSKEYLFHAAILRLRPDIGAVLHVHPAYATTFAVKQREIPMVTDAAFKQLPMPRVPFAPSGTTELQENVINVIENNPDSKVLLLEKHGIVCMGSNICMAYNIADLTEELAKIAYLAERL